MPFLVGLHTSRRHLEDLEGPLRMEDSHTLQRYKPDVAIVGQSEGLDEVVGDGHEMEDTCKINDY